MAEKKKLFFIEQQNLFYVAAELFGALQEWPHELRNQR